MTSTVLQYSSVVYILCRLRASTTVTLPADTYTAWHLDFTRNSEERTRHGVTTVTKRDLPGSKLNASRT
jgi:hypothetical protein